MGAGSQSKTIRSVHGRLQVQYFSIGTQSLRDVWRNPLYVFGIRQLLQRLSVFVKRDQACKRVLWEAEACSVSAYAFGIRPHAASLSRCDTLGHDFASRLLGRAVSRVLSCTLWERSAVIHLGRQLPAASSDHYPKDSGEEPCREAPFA